MPALEIRQLQYFIAVAEELHFGRAAKRLAMTQPPLSMAIQKLEQQVGFDLFDRSGRKVQLTSAGLALLDHARRAVAETEHVEQVADALREGRAGTLRLGFVGTSIFETLPTVLRAFRLRAPDVRFELESGNSANQAAGLEEHRLDLAILRPLRRSKDLEYVTIRDDSLVAALPGDSRLAEGDGPLPVEELAEELFILFPEDEAPGLHRCVARACSAAGFTPTLAYSVSRMQDLVGFVAAGLGVSLVPSVVGNLKLDGVVYRPLLGSSVAAELAMAYHRSLAAGATGELIRLAVEVAVATRRDPEDAAPAP